MRYYVERFEPLEMGGRQYLFLPSGVREVPGEWGKDWIGNLRSDSGRLLEARELEALLPEEVNREQLREELQQRGILRPIHMGLHPPRKMTLLGNHSEQLELLAEFVSSHCGMAASSISLNSKMDRATDCMFVYVDPYHRKDLERALHDRPEGVKWIQTCYRLDRFLYLDNPYLPELENPDHFSAIAALRDKAGDASRGEEDFFEMFEGTTAEPPAIPLNPFERGLVDFLLLKRIQLLCGMAHERFRIDHFHTAETWDLLTGRKTTTIVTHYETAGLPHF